MRMIMVAVVVGALAGCAKSPGEVCFDKVRPGLKDPTTATLIRWQQDGEQLGVAVEVRAANGYGGFGHVYARCQPDGIKWYTNAQDALLR